METAWFVLAAGKDAIGDGVRIRVVLSFDPDVGRTELLDDIEVTGDPGRVFGHQIKWWQHVKLAIDPLRPVFLPVGRKWNDGRSNMLPHKLQTLLFKVVNGATAEDPHGAVVEIRQQVTFPVSPDIGTHSFDVRHRQDVQHSQ